MDPIRPIAPSTSSLPIPPALAPESVKREQRRDRQEQRRGGEPDEGNPEEEFELVDDDEDDWDGTERRGAAADRGASPAAGVERSPDEGDDDGPPLHIDISV